MDADHPPNGVLFPRRITACKHCDEDVAGSFARHIPLVGLSHALEFLPADLLAACDAMLDLLPLTPAMAAEVAHRLTGSLSTLLLDADQATALTPRVLRLARRPGQDADAYLTKMLDILERDRQAAALSARRTTQGRSASDITLDRLHGMDEAVTLGRDVARDLAAYAAG